MIRECTVCGRPFSAKTPNQKYCSTECSDKAVKKRKMELQEENKKQEKRKESMRRAGKIKKSLVEYAKEAMAAGMTYGQYMASVERAGRRWKSE